VFKKGKSLREKLLPGRISCFDCTKKGGRLSGWASGRARSNVKGLRVVVGESFSKKKKKTRGGEEKVGYNLTRVHNMSAEKKVEARAYASGKRKWPGTFRRFAKKKGLHLARLRMETKRLAGKERACVGALFEP